MVNYEILDLNHKDPNSSIMFKTRTHQQYFNIILLDFLQTSVFAVNKNCVESLLVIIANPQFGDGVKSLKNAVNEFKNWLDQDIQLEHNGEVRNFWFPAINKEVSIKITRAEFIKICGNISKHNVLCLNRQAETIKKIFAKNNISIELIEALLIMEEFYEQFHDDLFNYHASTIAEFLNNIRWAVYEYLKPLYDKSVEWYLHDTLKDMAYRYNYPPEIKNAYVRELFWNLMNDVRSPPYMPKFQVTRYLKMRY